MSYDKKTWAPKDKITSAALNNMENGILDATPFVIPVTITMDGETPIATTSVTFEQIKDAYAAGRPLTAEIVLPDDVGCLRLRHLVNDAKTNPSMFSFSGVADFSGTGETPDPSYYEFTMTATGTDVKIISLT